MTSFGIQILPIFKTDVPLAKNIKLFRVGKVWRARASLKCGVILVNMINSLSNELSDPMIVTQLDNDDENVRGKNMFMF